MKSLEVSRDIHSLEILKQEIRKKYKNCHIDEQELEHTVHMSAGMLHGRSTLERIITDGTISFKEKEEKPQKILWQNHLIQLENGTTITVEIQDATFMVDIIRLGKEEEVSIHIENPDPKLLENLIGYLYRHHYGGFKENRIEFTSPMILEIQNRLETIKWVERVNFSRGTHTKVKSMIGQMSFSHK